MAAVDAGSHRTALRPRRISESAPAALMEGPISGDAGKSNDDSASRKTGAGVMATGTRCPARPTGCYAVCARFFWNARQVIARLKGSSVSPGFKRCVA